MPSPLAHIATGFAVYRLFRNRLDQSGDQESVPLSLTVGASLLPDLDAIAGFAFKDMSRFHNGGSHSLMAGLGLSGILASLSLYKPSSRFRHWFIAATASNLLHLFMDSFSTRRGMMLFWPLIRTRFRMPVKLFYGVQWGLSPRRSEHLRTVANEALFSVLLIMLVDIFISRQAATSRGNPCASG